VRLTVKKRFEDGLQGLPPNRRKSAVRALEKFIEEPRRRSLDFRPLAGVPGFFIIDPQAGDRIILQKIAEDHYSVEDVGPHDNVYRRWLR